MKETKKQKSKFRALNLPLSTKIPFGMTEEEFLENASRVFNKQKLFAKQLETYVESNFVNNPVEESLKTDQGYIFNSETISKILSNKFKLTDWETEFIEKKTAGIDLSITQNTKFQEIATKALQ